MPAKSLFAGMAGSYGFYRQMLPLEPNCIQGAGINQRQVSG